MDEQLIDRLLNTLGASMVKYFGAELHGAENIPTDGGALIVSNHAFLAIDSAALVTLIYRQTGRYARGLAEKLLFSPMARKLGVTRILSRVGAVKGTRQNAVRLLASGNLVLCYPGGAVESLKGPSRRYELRWEKSRGFMHVAAAAGVPIVPVMAVGIDEAYPALGKEHFFARNVIGKKRYDLPFVLGLGPLPFPVKFDYHVAEPFELPSVEALEDPERLALEHRKLWHRTQNFLDARVRDRGGPGLSVALRHRLGLRSEPSGVVPPGVLAPPGADSDSSDTSAPQGSIPVPRAIRR